jgi:pyruvate/2-oxoglutarate dehydrogenase complex dihydrolipoamide acyltransferase (E2) component
MSGAVKSVGRSIGKLFGGGETKQAFATEAAKQEAATAQASAAQAMAAQTARVATPEERAVALRRRRGARALLSQERMDAEAGLAGDQTTLGG